MRIIFYFFRQKKKKKFRSGPQENLSTTKCEKKLSLFFIGLKGRKKERKKENQRQGKEDGSFAARWRDGFQREGERQR